MIWSDKADTRQSKKAENSYICVADDLFVNAQKKKGCKYMKIGSVNIKTPVA